MIEYVPYLFEICLSFTIGMVAIFLYKINRKSELALVGVAFFLNAVPSIVNLAMGGPYLAMRLYEQGYTPFEMGLFLFQLFLLESIFKIVFAVIVVVGLVKLSRKT